MRYLILGLGFLSTHVAEYLSKYGEVTVTYRSLERVKEVYYKLLKEKGVNFVKLDPLSDVDLLKRIIGGVLMQSSYSILNSKNIKYMLRL